MKNTGVPSEDHFDAYVRAQGKSCCLIPFEDQKALVGRNKGRIVKSSAKPCDRIVVGNGRTVFAEIKSTQDPVGFRFTLLREGQKAYGAMIVTAGGEYHVFVHRIAKDEWYRIPYQDIREASLAGRKTLRWEEMQKYRNAALENFGK